MAKKRIISAALILGAVGAVVVLLLLPGRSKSIEQPTNGRTTNVKIMEVRPAPLKDWIELPASVEPFLSTEVPAEVEGRVDWIGPKEGDRIDKSGMPIMRIDQRTFRAQLDEALAAHELSDRKCQRAVELHAQGALSEEQLDQCRTQVASDAARLEIAQIQIDIRFIMIELIFLKIGLLTKKIIICSVVTQLLKWLQWLRIFRQKLNV